MKKSILLLATLAALAPCFPVASNAATQVYDLKADWSDTQNPNGTWSYRRDDGNATLLSSAPYPWVTPNQFLDSITKTAAADVVPGYLEAGDISVKFFSGSGLIVRWTAPTDGTINVSGSFWNGNPECSDVVEWTLRHNGSQLSGGSATGLRNSPGQLSSGSAGATALLNIAVQAGDSLELGLSSWFLCGFENVNGLNFTVALTSASFDPVAAIEDLALAVVAMNLQNGIENSLDSKLDAALDALIDANFNNDGAVCNSLAAFISAVEAQRGKKITNAQADQLSASAQQIKAMLNCGN